MASSKKPRNGDLAGAVDGFLSRHSLQRKRVCLGLSGGVDSVVLLHVLNSLKRKKKYSLHAVHVHHGLSPNADEWAEFCRNLCRQWRRGLSLRPGQGEKDSEEREGADRGVRLPGFLGELSHLAGAA